MAQRDYSDGKSISVIQGSRRQHAACADFNLLGVADLGGGSKVDLDFYLTFG